MSIWPSRHDSSRAPSPSQFGHTHALQREYSVLRLLLRLNCALDRARRCWLSLRSCFECSDSPSPIEFRLVAGHRPACCYRRGIRRVEMSPFAVLVNGLSAIHRVHRGKRGVKQGAGRSSHRRASAPILIRIHDYQLACGAGRQAATACRKRRDSRAQQAALAATVAVKR